MAPIPRRDPPALSLALALDAGSGVPLHRQLYARIRDAILGGGLAPGARLPPSRALAADLEVSRSTVLQALEQLRAEGYLTARQGSGTRVAAALPEALLRAPAASPRPEEDGAVAGSVSRRSRARAALPPDGLPAAPAPLLLRPGLPALDAFPRRLWARLLVRRSRMLAVHQLDYGDPAGHGPLREAIARHVSTSRGVRCHAGQVIVTAGAQQALELAAQILLDPGDTAFVEEPGYLGARSALLGASARLVPLEVDRDGVRIPRHGGGAGAPRLIYVTPSHQFPLGTTLSLARRLELLRWAGECGAWILEDDYDSEFHYGGGPLTAVQGLDAGGRVVYVGTFSKTLFPALRLGFLVVPESLVPAFVQVRHTADQQPPLLEQLVLDDFIREGHLARHIRRMRRLYEGRQAALLEALRRECPPELLQVGPVGAGLHLTAFLPEAADDRAVAGRASRLGAGVVPLSRYYLGPAARPGLLLGFATVPEARAHEAARLLSRALRHPRAATAPRPPAMLEA